MIKKPRHEEELLTEDKILYLLSPKVETAAAESATPGKQKMVLQRMNKKSPPIITGRTTIFFTTLNS